MISLVKKDYDSTKIYRKTQKKGASQTYDTPSPEIASVPSVEVSSQQEISVRSVGSVGGYSMNVAAWVRQDAIPSYTMGSEMPCIF